MGDEEDKPKTIYDRNKEGTLEAVAILWRALCDKPKTIRKYMARDGIITSIDQDVYSPKTDPSLSEHIDDFETWTAYKIHGDPDFVEIDMMSSAVIYRVTLWQLEDGEMEATEAMCSSVWRQGPGGDWKCVVHHMATIE